MTPGHRQSTPDAVRVSRTDRPGRAATARRFASGVAIGLFLSLVGAYGSDRLPILWRTLMLVTISVSAVWMGMLAYRLVGRSRRIAAHWMVHGVVAALAMTAPMALLAWAMLQPFARPPPLAALPGFLPMSLVTSVFFCVWAAQRAHARVAPPVPAAAAAPKFLARLPPKLRGGELWAVEAEDHYLRLHTSKGQDLVLMRLSDALAELAGIEGAQTHRSWWVARDAIERIERGDGRAVLTLKNGAKAPVSRTHARALRARGWL